jgi:trk system potassium uptake protein TrkA
MKIIILGAGQVGRTAAYHLAREPANEVTVVDVKDELLRDLQDRIDIRTIVGSATQPSILEAAGARDADIFIALTNSDEVNMTACQIAWSLFNKDTTRIARIRSADFTKHRKLFFDEDRAFAVDVPISPEQLVTDHVVRLIQYPGALQVLDFAEGRVRLVGVKALRGGALVGQQLKQLAGHIKGHDARVAAIYRNGQSIKPTGDTVVEHGDEVFFIAARDASPSNSATPSF